MADLERLNADLDWLEAHERATGALAAEERAFGQLRSRLLRQYAGQYVALYQGQVVDHNPDDEELAGRMFARLGDMPFYIAQVDKTPAVIDLPWT